MRYIVKYVNPNNCIRSTPYTFETCERWEFNEFMKKVKTYPGSYQIVLIEKIRETKKRK